MESRQLKVSKTARIYTLGNTETAKNIWIIFHGYAQLASTFIKEFQTLINEETAVIAPEGMHRFYRRGFYGEVVASWMTSEDRLSDIADNAAYLNQVYNDWIKPNQKVHVLGFSQGVATACRWLAESTFPIENLVLWAGSFPQDLTTSKTSSMTIGRCFMAYDKEDPFWNEESWLKQLKSIGAFGIQPIVFSFNGGHSIPKVALEAFKTEFL